MFFRAPCEQSQHRRDERLSTLVDLVGVDGLLRSDTRSVTLVDHVRGCTTCISALNELVTARTQLSSFGDAEGAAPTDDGFRHVMAALSHEREEERVRRRPRQWLVLAAGVTAIVLVGSYGVRRQREAHVRAMTDEAIVSGAQAAFRRAEREYGDAVALLREEVSRKGDPRVAAGARVLEAAREQAEKLVSEKRADPEREALLRSAWRAEVRYYE
ncbi:MAG: hypothetical protein ABI321_22540, partial [Polyangia bacterium]